MMVHLHKERFPKGTYNKLKIKKIGPCRILEKRNNNAYKVGLPDNLDISPIFSVFDLYAFHGYDEDVEAMDRRCFIATPISVTAKGISSCQALISLRVFHYFDSHNVVGASPLPK